MSAHGERKPSTTSSTPDGSHLRLVLNLMMVIPLRTEAAGATVKYILYYIVILCRGRCITAGFIGLLEGCRSGQSGATYGNMKQRKPLMAVSEEDLLGWKADFPHWHFIVLISQSLYCKGSASNRWHSLLAK